jgi:hypothetical protein
LHHFPLDLNLDNRSQHFNRPATTSPSGQGDYLFAMDTSTQYERDLRSAGKAYKREKKAHAKWAHGTRPMPGITANLVTGEVTGGNAAARTKTRPEKRWE